MDEYKVESVAAKWAMLLDGMFIRNSPHDTVSESA
jgi:hypothetical protein